jgi:hypothetical protein
MDRYFLTWVANRGRVIERIPFSFMEADVTNHRISNVYDLDTEVSRSWAFLFATSRHSRKRLQHYEEFLKPSPPEWTVDNISRKWLRSKHLGTLTGPDRPWDFYYHLQWQRYRQVINKALNKDLVSYAQFPIFETRLRQLRHYMDSQKPRGLHQLWKDNRDSLNYYTFWGVIIFGLLSVFLAFFSLAVSVAQTVASFRALELATPPAPTT